MAKLLLVEDDKMISSMYMRRFTLEGFEVIQAFNGQEGLDTAHKERPDLILLDIMMPVMDGYTMYNKLQADPVIQSIPVIFLTNLSDDRKWASVLGGDNYIVKASWSLDDVVKVIRKKLGLEPNPPTPVS
jgi:two-component system, cell cycle response regulator DivK